MSLHADTPIFMFLISPWNFFLWPTTLKIISSHFSFPHDIKIQGQTAGVKFLSLVASMKMSLALLVLACISSNHYQPCWLVQAGKGYAITPRTAASSVSAKSTLAITHPNFVARHARSQNPADPACFSRMLHISNLKAPFKAPHRLLVYLVQNCHLETGKLKPPGCRTPPRFTISPQTDCPPRAPVAAAAAAGNYMTVLWLRTEGER